MEKIFEVYSIKMVRKDMEQDVFSIRSPLNIVDFVREKIGQDDRESLCVLCVNTKLQITAFHKVSTGTVNMSLAHPREIFKTAILNNAVSIFLAHNHPSGDPIESPEDVEMTQRIIECGRLLGIELLDHIIVSDRGYTSLKEKGII